jgi:tetratricopeptide (TPR) repeat protein
MRALMAARVLLGIGGLVLGPIALIRRDYWLLYFAAPLILTGLVLVATGLRIAAIPAASVVCITHSFLGLRVRERRFDRSDVTALDLYRVAGSERERDSDTWYVRMCVGRRGYTIGKYDTRMDALMARRDIDEALGALPVAPREEQKGGAARDHYQQGMALLRSGDVEGAKSAFEQALAFAGEPLLRRMITQRLEELSRC